MTCAPVDIGAARYLTPEPEIGATEPVARQAIRRTASHGVPELAADAGRRLGLAGEAIDVLVRAAPERYDGSGVPDGLRGAEIPFAARIIAACTGGEDPEISAAVAASRAVRGPARSACAPSGSVHTPSLRPRAGVRGVSGQTSSANS
jgi:hypothetical protein